MSALLMAMAMFLAVGTAVAQVDEPVAEPDADAPAVDVVEEAEAADATAAADEATTEAVADATPVLLRFRYTKGETLTYDTTLEGVGSVHVMGRAQAIALNGELRTKMQVQDITDEGDYVMLTTVDIADLQVTVDGQAMPPPGQTMQVRTVMDARGKIKQLEVIEQPATDTPQSPWNGPMARMLTGGLDLTEIAMNQDMAAFPAEAARPGEEWSGVTRTVQVAGEAQPLEITTRYDGDVEVDGVMCARLDSSATIQSAAFGEMAQMLGMQGTTSAASRTWFDAEAGRVRASMEQTEVDMRVNLPQEMTGAEQAVGIYLEMFITANSKLLPSVAEE